MSYFIDEDFLRAGLPQLFALETKFAETSQDESLAAGKKFATMTACLDEISALVDEKQNAVPADVFYLIDEVSRFVTENSPLMAPRLVCDAFSNSSLGAPTLHEQALNSRLAQMAQNLDVMMSTQHYRL